MRIGQRQFFHRFTMDVSIISPVLTTKGCKSSHAYIYTCAHSQSKTIHDPIAFLRDSYSFAASLHATNLRATAIVEQIQRRIYSVE